MWLKIKTIFCNVIFGFKINWQSSHKLFIYKCVYSLLLVFAPIAISYVWKFIINDLTNKIFVMIPIFLSIYIVLKIFNYIMSVINDYLIMRYYDARTFYIDNILISKLCRVNLAYFDSSSMSDKIERIKANTGMLHDTAWQAFDIITQTVAIVTCTIILSTINPIFGIINISLVIPSFIANKIYSKKMYNLSLSQTRDNRLMNYYINRISDINNQSEVKLNHFSSYFVKRSDNIWHNLFKINRKEEIKQTKYQIIFSELRILGPIFTLLTSVPQVISGVIGLGDMQFYFNTSNSLQSQVNDFFQNTNSFLINNIKIDELRKLINEEPEQEKSGQLTLTAAPKIEFENVTFSYPNMTQTVLNNCSFIIESNERIALIGLNGAGKTTILKLLFGFYSPSSGKIKFNDIDIMEYDIYSVRKVFGTLFQDFIMYCLPLREIIALPNFNERFNNERIENAAQTTGFKNVISSWDDGYDSVLGRYYASNGKDLSGGQWQLLSLTRAYFQDSPIMVLDEPSASLDPISEKKIFNQLYDLSFGKGSIIITHQLSNIKLADKILL